MKLRLKFEKGDEIKFIGHLDLLRVFQKTIRRAKLPIAYSEGFNPHQIISFAQPLSLGATSEGEYVDIELTKEMGEDEIRDKLNIEFPKGLRVLKVIPLINDTRSGMASIEAAKYKVEFTINKPVQDMNDLVNQFFVQQEIWVEKQTKKKTKQVNIKEWIYEINLESSKKGYILSLFVAAGSRNNLKPDLVLDALFNRFGWNHESSENRIHRVDLFTKKNDELVSLENVQ